MLTEPDPGSDVYRRDIVFRKLDDLFQPGSANGPVVLLLEIHRFKQIKDVYGLHTGDRVIASYARPLQRVVSRFLMPVATSRVR